MTVEHVDEMPSQRRTKPPKPEYEEIRELLRDPENAHKICILGHGMFPADAQNMALSIRATPPLGDFHTSVRSINLPKNIDKVAVYGGYQLPDSELEKLMGEGWMKKHLAKRATDAEST